MVGRLATLNRLRQIAQTFARHGLGGIVDQLGLADSTLKHRPGAQHKPAARLGRRLSLALNDLGPTFIKFGQLLATREDILPRAAARELSILCDDARSLPTRTIRREIERSLGKSIDQLFAHFSPEPLATGSIAQVHAARTRDGHEVVVKVRRPKIDRVIARDLEVLRAVADLVTSRIPDLARHDPAGFVAEFSRALLRELDFEVEAQTLTRAQKSVRSTARVPRPWPELSSDSILTQERLWGTPSARVRDERIKAIAAADLVRCFTTQFLRSPFFHADPHAGNILVNPQGGVQLLDWGTVGELTRPMRKTLAQILRSAARRDDEAVARAFLTVVHVPNGLDREAYMRDAKALVRALLGHPLGQTSVAALMQQLFCVTQTHGLRLRSDYFLLLRSVALLDGVLRKLDPQIDPVAVTKGHIARSFWHPAWLFAAARSALYNGLNWARANRLRAASVGLAICLGGVLWISHAVRGATPTGNGASALGPHDAQRAVSARFIRNCALHQRPDQDSPRLLRISSGSNALVLGNTRYFWKVRTDSGHHGYALKACLSPAPTSTPTDSLSP